MKKILFILQEYTQGGITKCLENLLGFFQESDYDIYIYSLYEDGGDYYKKVFADYIVKKSTLYYLLHDNVYTRKVMGAYNKLMNSLNFGFLYRYEASYLQKNYHFDVVVAYHEGMAVEFASYFTGAKKITWFHCDPKVLGTHLIQEYGRFYCQMDAVVGVSSVVKTSFMELMPQYKGKVYVIHNLLDTDFIKKNARFHIADYPKDSEHTFNIISIGRSNKVKQFEKIPSIMRRILDSGVDFVYWYIISSGQECDGEIINAIKDNGVEDYVKMLGEKDNPYPYIKRSDLLVSTSYSEAYPTVINEAQTLGVPVLANNYPSAFEIVSEGCGYICPLEDMAKLICSISKNENEMYSKMRFHVAAFKYDNKQIFQRVIDLFS